MRALTYDRYTDAAGLRFTEQPVPEPGGGRVRVRVVAAGLNPFDWHMHRGEPWIMRTQAGFRFDGVRTAGADVAGIVDAVGSGVTALAVGDRVLGSLGGGALAEFAVAKAGAFARLPEGVSWEDAAATPMAGLTALQGLRDGGGLREGGSVLVWGASGGVGHLAVQLARVLGAARVDAVCSSRNVALVRGLGADRVFDYTKGEPGAESVAGEYDIVLDTVATASIARLRHLLRPEGRVSMVGGLSRGRVLGPLSSLMSRTAAGKVRAISGFSPGGWPTARSRRSCRRCSRSTAR
jgi:NADPH:quinone reductase-like Zn-dependent oxidoreductase